MIKKRDIPLKKKIGVRKLWLFLIPIFFILTILILFKTVFIIGYVPSASMEPTLKENSLILGLRVYGDIDNGDIVIFNHDGELYVKRIAGTGGEVIEVDGKVYEIPDGCYFMLGDNSANSYDSRYWDNPYVERQSIKAKLILP